MIITNIEKSLYFCFTHSSKFHLKKQELIKTEFVSRANLVKYYTDLNINGITKTVKLFEWGGTILY